MKKNMKKAFASLLAATMVMSMSVTAWADNADAPTEAAPTESESTTENQDASFTKKYTATNENTANPEEIFTFKFTADKVKNSNKNLSKEDMPQIKDSTVKFEVGEAKKDGENKTVNVALSDVKWPGVGIYYYDVEEVAGNVAGVKYDNKKAKLKVTVAYDKGTKTYYTAFVTMESDLEKQEDGTTDPKKKTTGFDNEYSAGKLTIEKTAIGNLADKDKEFNVDVVLTAPKNDDESYKEVTSMVVWTDGLISGFWDNSGWEDNQVTKTFTLKDGETVTIENIPYGVAYSVVEHDYTAEADGAYEKAQYAKDLTEDATKENTKVEEKGVTGEITKELEKVDIVNIKGTVVDTGILLDSAPYVLLLAIAGVGAFAVATKKREEEF